MKDIEIAKKQLFESNLTLCIVKDREVIFTSKLRGVRAFLRAVDEIREQIENASIADKVIGKAIALLCIHLKVKAIYATTLSNEARALLAEKGIHVEWMTLADKILDVDRSAICPFEQLVANIEEPSEAYRVLKDALRHRDQSRSI